jgi:hypothetical protein
MHGEGLRFEKLVPMGGDTPRNLPSGRKVPHKNWVKWTFQDVRSPSGTEIWPSGETRNGWDVDFA